MVSGVRFQAWIGINVIRKLAVKHVAVSVHHLQRIGVWHFAGTKRHLKLNGIVFIFCRQQIFNISNISQEVSNKYLPYRLFTPYRIRTGR
ncbi:hypothetical protein ESCOCP296M_23985 [Escherichia coli]|nr:hypothetical protein BvCmsKSNP115_00369 [Escherichia coli]